MALKTTHAALLFLLFISAAAGGAFWWVQTKIGIPGALYQYYPVNTGFYMELAPGDRLTHQFVRYLSEQANLDDQRLVQKGVSKRPIAPPPIASAPSGTVFPGSAPVKPLGRTVKASLFPHPSVHLLTPSLTNKAAGVSRTGPDVAHTTTTPVFALPAESLPSASEVVAEKIFLERARKERRFRHAFLEKFNDTFESYFSIGTWPTVPLIPALKAVDTTDTKALTHVISTGSGDIPLVAPQGNVLVIFPLRQNLKLSAIVQRFDMETSDFQSHHAGNWDYYEEEGNGTCLAVLDQKLLVTSTSAAMELALSHHASDAANVFDESENKAFLAQLPFFRQGTFLLNNRVYAPKTSLNGAPPSQMTNVILPLIAGSVQLQPGNVLSFQSVAPIYLDNIPDENLRKRLRSVYYSPLVLDSQAQKLPVDTALMLSVANLDQYYDVYESSLMPTGVRQWVNSADMVLGTFKLNLRRDVIGLFQKRSVLAATSGKHLPYLMMDATDAKTKSLTQVSTVLSSDVLPWHEHHEKRGSFQLNTVQLPPSPWGAGGPLSYGTIENSVAFAAPSDYLALLQTNTGKTQNLTTVPLFQSVTRGFPSKVNASLYLNLQNPSAFNSLIPGMNQLTPWTDAIAAACVLSPYHNAGADAGTVDVLNTYINIKIPTRN